MDSIDRIVAEMPRVENEFPLPDRVTSEWSDDDAWHHTIFNDAIEAQCYHLAELGWRPPDSKVT